MKKHNINDLAVFSGTPTFTRIRPIGQLFAPPVDEFLELLRIPYESRHLTNDGVLVRQLEEDLREYHGVRNCIAVASAALGLTMLSQVFANGRNGQVIMPAFSYRGLPHFVKWAGQQPRYCDVDPVSHCLDPGCVEDMIDKQTTSILHVCNFNSPGDIAGLCEIAGKYDVPVFLDSVYAMGCSLNGVMLGGLGKAEVYSIHATKLLNGFEGGYITTDDDNLAELLRWQRNFALPGLQPDRYDGNQYILGINAKLNELHAAMALLSLRRIDEIIERNKRRYLAYCEIIAQIPGLKILPCNDSLADKRNYQMAVIEIGEEWPLSRDQIHVLLRAEGCAINPYYSPPLYRSASMSGQPETFSLPVTEKLSKRFLQLPVGEHVTVEDIHEIGHLLEFLHLNGAEIALRLNTLEH